MIFFLSGHQGEGSSSGGRSVDDETFGYMTNNLNQYTSLSDEYGNTIIRKYDKAGNMIENDEFYFQYDYKNRLVKATRNNPPTPLPGGGQEEYMIVTMNYDVLGRRVEKHIDRKANEGEKVRYTYSNLDAIQEERTYNIGEGRNLKKELIYGGGIDDIEGYILTRGDEVRTFRYQKNHQNSVTAITDDTGKVVESYRYDAFGNLILGFSKNAGKQSTLPGAKNEQRNTNQQDSKMWLKNDRLYTARELDEELGLYYYRGRHYDSRIGRFIQRDPIDMIDDVNLYRYVGNNSVNYVDPMGLAAYDTAGVKKRMTDTEIAFAVLEVAVDVAIDVFDVYGQVEEIGEVMQETSEAVGLATATTCSAYMIKAMAVTQGTSLAFSVSGCPLGGFAVSAGMYMAGEAVEDFGKTAKERRQQRKNENQKNDGQERNANQDKKLNDGEIEKLKKAGYDIHDLKPDSKFDLYKDVDGNINYKRKPNYGTSEPVPIDLNINDF